jgi:dCMP deaminase
MGVFNMSDHHKTLMNVAWSHAALSMDPSTKVGAIITDQGKIVSWGFNHIPNRIPHTVDMLHDREWKYPRIIHAEHHAMSQIGMHSLRYPIMYVTHHPCERCAAAIIHGGIRELYTHKPPSDMTERWPGMKVASEMFLEAKIPLNFIEP